MSLTLLDSYDAVVGECKKWAVSVVIVSDGFKYPDDYSEAPFTCANIGVSQSKREIYAHEDCKLRPEFPGELLHELAHIIVGDDIHLVEEVESGMLALEMLIAQELDIAGWELNMKEYGLTTGYLPWGKATEEQRMTTVGQSLAEAHARGFVTEMGLVKRP